MITWSEIANCPMWNVVKIQMLSVTVGACLDQVYCSINVAKWDCEIVV